MSIAATRNYLKFSRRLEELVKGDYEDRIVILHGIPGSGKSLSAATEANKYNAIYFEAFPLMSPKAFLTQFCQKALGFIPPKSSSNGTLLLQVCEALQQRKQMVIVDEADYVFEKSTLVETMRAIHDRALKPCRQPLVMIGMSGISGYAGIDQKGRRYPQLAGRVTGLIQFEKADQSDFLALAGHYCPGLEIAPEVAAKIMANSDGDIRLIRAGLLECKRIGRSRNSNVIDMQAIGKRNLGMKEVS